MLYDRGMTALTISPAQRKALKAKAHDLSPVVMIGNDGLTPGVVKEAEIAIQSHNLIKVRVFGDDRENRIAIYEALCDKLGAAPVQHIGKLLVIWRPEPLIKDANAPTARGGNKTKKSIQAPRSPNRPINRGATSTSERSARRTAATKPFGKTVGSKVEAPARKVASKSASARPTRANAAESKIGWSSPGYKRAAAPTGPVKRRKVRQASTKKKSLG
jgi:putative YhbY family RNA-binding protein